MFPLLALSGAKRPSLIAWPRMRADAFGCMLERQFGFRDPKFNCSLTGYVNKGDPCRNTTAYYEGPSLPDAVARKVSPDVGSISLSWEGGALQEVTVTFQKVLPEAQARKALGLPPSGAPLPANVQSVDVQRCAKDASCLLLTGFDHQGSGDVDCGD
jgi:hypothetical protein